MASRPQTDSAAQRLVDALPHAMQPPLAPCRVRGLPRRILPREIAPGAASVQHVEERVDEEPQRPRARPTTPCWSREQRLELRPFGIREVTGIKGASIHGRAWHRRSLCWGTCVGGLLHLPGTWPQGVIVG